MSGHGAVVEILGLAMHEALERRLLGPAPARVAGRERLVKRAQGDPILQRESQVARDECALAGAETAGAVVNRSAGIWRRKGLEPG